MEIKSWMWEEVKSEMGRERREENEQLTVRGWCKDWKRKKMKGWVREGWRLKGKKRKGENVKVSVNGKQRLKRKGRLSEGGVKTERGEKWKGVCESEVNIEKEKESGK